ncbi:MAG: methyltransferase type 11 [Stygiobacter sp. RIFOXYC12_FULL_38_8]|nr:MAG: methyltransferase type 11 [Stygiobacter sp. GWC2_38_9]OGU81468.1 MAG: methyltransferase type 11 [Stygiobacter sp. RIFOXYA12_FULL_38_9]OGV06325.1 MAG: methyltransferase type 11 [Stygiobacter sp. RIFOXYB2_FULL_37_11]OGV11066.1 MAG: methyltransferase type 11 [Stygiobacter sp. RIFOXYA2_FULL_38_8]OGV16076.1 MAG: methyltransferase type 11 [Stygiobacter sp. RIFOXYC2_FULL_38_25]OGV28463.1 MAG: methyltransferase type 11 [Stygiobacter sp. RIFOXYC12_FULL_38_8]OGV80553.1 MAG: methyltransferase ty
MSRANTDICSVELAGGLDNRFRRLFQNPQKILSLYLKEGQTALDVGCGPGFFTLDMAKLVGETGRVIGADLQEGMLSIVRGKVKGTELENRIVLHKCGQDKIGLTDRVDFVLMFYMVHEVPNKNSLFSEIAKLLNPNGKVLLVEPPIHVSRAAFEETLQIARSCGLKVISRPKMFPDKVAVLSAE